MMQPASVKDAYAAWADTYDTCSNRTRDADAALLRATTLPLAGAVVVEIGAGTGKNTVHLAEQAARVVAIDLSPVMLAEAARRDLGQHVTLVEHDIALPWPVHDGAADVVVGNLVLEHVASLGPVFAQAHRVLAPGGVLYLAELHPYRQWRGAGARFEGPGGAIRIEAFVHATADYVMAALGAGFGLAGMAEVVDDISDGSSDGSAPPRLLQLIFHKPTHSL